MKNVRSALWLILERCQADIPPEMEDLLSNQFGVLGKEHALGILHAFRPFALQLAKSTAKRERQKLVEEFASDNPQWLLYAAAAWTARALALAEYLERADLAIMPKKWAGEQALSMIDDFEADESWLWPFDSEPPWPEDDGEDDNV
jgi:hypothetical protein